MTAPAPGSPLLQLKRCTIRFGGLTAVSALDLEVRGDELVGLIGPNGAGKTTVFNLITGVYAPTEGEIAFEGQSIIGNKPYVITAHGIARTFQNIRLFPSLTVFDNVRVAFHLHLISGVSHALVRGSGFLKEEAEISEQVLELLKIFRLENFANDEARSLPYGDQRRLEIVRALATRPKLLLLDEPAAGLRHMEKQRLAALLRQLRDGGMSVLLVEHDMGFVMDLADRVVVLDFGTKIAEGTPDAIKTNPDVIKAYLGATA